MQSRQDKRIFFCPVHNASTPCSLQAFGIRYIQKPGASMELRQLQCYLKIRYINGALRSGYTTMCNAQCNNSEDNLF